MLLTHERKYLESFERSVWGEVESPRMRWMILNQDISQSLKEMEQFFTETLSKINNQRTLVRMLFKDYGDNMDHMISIIKAFGMEQWLEDDLIAKLHQTKEYRETLKK